MKKANELDKQLVFAAALIVAIGGLIYELLLATTVSYIFGDSITSFSLTIGIVLFGMGIGSLVAQQLQARSSVSFVWTELILSVVGGNAVLILFWIYAHTLLIWPIFIVLSLIIGICIGLEIPLMIGLVKQQSSKDTQTILSRVLALDYMGALIASLLFPFLLLPYLGLVRTSLAVGMLNALIALFITLKISSKTNRLTKLRRTAYAVCIGLVMLLAVSHHLERAVNTAGYSDPVVYYKLSPYQKIAITTFRGDTRLYLNDQLQFSSIDEVRYHEFLAHTSLGIAETPKNVLIIGGGDGLLAREVLKHSTVENITVVDIDPAVTSIAKNLPMLTRINEDALNSGRVHVVNQDAYRYLQTTERSYDVIIADLVDPSNEKLAKLYSLEFYKTVHKHLNEDGVFMTQAGSTFFTPNAHQLIKQTLKQSDNQRFITSLTHNIPSFGEWGFLLSTTDPLNLDDLNVPDSANYLTSEVVNNSIGYSNDFATSISNEQVSTLLKPTIYQVYREDMREWSY